MFYKYALMKIPVIIKLILEFCDTNIKINSFLNLIKKKWRLNNVKKINETKSWFENVNKKLE